jgi:3-deoxy-manno-octulosonate cytidylyltransferase (CMP-KDO synthetase)
MLEPCAQHALACARLPHGEGRRIRHGMNPIVVIPARMAATRLPGKPLADIAGRPMILRVLDAARAGGIGPVLVAAGDREIVDIVRADGGRAELTDAGLASGSDRVLAALRAADPDRTHDVVVNLQGDLPDLPAHALAELMAALAADGDADMATLAVADDSDEARSNPNIVKAVLAERDSLPARALYFTRAPAPWGPGPVWKHVGIYAYRRPALERFCALPPSKLEQREKLEQLRALEAGMRIVVAPLDGAPDGVDTPEDLERARARFSA